MMFKTFATLAALFVSSVSAAPAEIRQTITAKSCADVTADLGKYNGGNNVGAAGLAFLCIKDVQSSNWDNSIYKHATCVAAATANGLESLTNALTCSHPETNFRPRFLPHLDFNVYASMVGGCAWDTPNACPVTQQKYINFVNRQIDDADLPRPSNNEIVGWYKVLTKWTATGSTIPYSNFDDWLHYGA